MPTTPVTELPLDCATLVDLCRYRAAEQPDRRTFVFLDDGVDVSDSLTLGELDRRARAIAAKLRRYAPAGTRAVLSYPPGLDFVAAFYGCLYAGVIAVPTAPLGRTRADNRFARFQAIVDSCAPELLLSNADMLDRAEPALLETPALHGLTLIATDEVAAAADTADADTADADATGWQPSRVDPDTVAYLQYTSGTTRAPRGVVLTHANVMHNLALIVQNGAREAEDFGRVPPSVSWLPPFHDMGLVGNVIQPLFIGHDVVLMPPTVFIQHPFAWLRAISNRGEALTGSPGFGYELCLRRIPESQRGRLDLSGLRIALIGDEPVRADTIDRFSEAFAGCGFRREAFLPSYGMAESTVMVSGGPVERGPVVGEFDDEALASGTVRPARPGTVPRRLVGVGQLQPSLTAAVVNPDTGEPCAPDEVGEILVSGPSIGTAYWNDPEETARTLRVRVPGHGDRAFLRTGSLGFRHDDQLFITCRVQDVVVLGGRRYCPYDIEETVSGCHPAVREGFSCAFTVDDGGPGARLVILAETATRYRVLADPAAAAQPEERPGSRRRVWAGDIEQSIRASVEAAHGIAVADVALLRMGGLPFTTSGKLRRAECRARYRARAFDSAIEPARPTVSVSPVRSDHD
jgi:acyl-CoA synthetase (AMP-forming)/AMP-acid ligase II